MSNCEAVLAKNGKNRRTNGNQTRIPLLLHRLRDLDGIQCGLDKSLCKIRNCVHNVVCYVL